jgi:hypothetical protein
MGRLRFLYTHILLARGFTVAKKVYEPLPNSNNVQFIRQNGYETVCNSSGVSPVEMVARLFSSCCRVQTMHDTLGYSNRSVSRWNRAGNDKRH